MDEFFQLKKNNTTVKTEVLAGITTFMTMAYIIFVNPNILSVAAGNDPAMISSLAFATCIGAAIGTLVMGLYAKLPFAEAPGMGLNAFFTFTVAPLFGFGGALGAVFISGILFILITVTGLREQIIGSIPMNIKYGITAGIGLFIAFLGLQGAGIVVDNGATLVGLTDFTKIADPELGPKVAGALIAIVGTLFIAILMKLNVKAAILYGVLACIGLSFIVHPPSLADGIGFSTVSFFKLDFGALFLNQGTFSIGYFFNSLTIVIIFTLVSMFDSIGTLIGVGERTGMVDKNGQLPNMKKALMADAVATTAGACLGTSSVAIYVESGTGIEAGGRTGLTAVVVGCLFILAIALAPFAALVPSYATAPALIIVGCLMLSTVKYIDFSDITEGLPAFITIAFMPFTYTISTGIAFGIISYVILNLFTKQTHKLNIVLYVLAVLFVIRFIVLP